MHVPIPELAYELKLVLEDLATDPRANPDGDPGHSEWVLQSIDGARPKLMALRRILEVSSGNGGRLLDIGAQVGSLVLLATRYGLQSAAVDLPRYAHRFGWLPGVDYRACDVGSSQLPFPPGSFDFVTYMDVIEHHAFSPKRVLLEIWRVLKPEGLLILTTPNHSSLVNRIMLLLGRSVYDRFDYFFETCAEREIYPGHHREYTAHELRAALNRTGFRLIELRAMESSLTDVWESLEADAGGTRRGLARYRHLLASALGAFLPGMGRILWVVGRKVGELNT